jgi:serine/threonine protein kinase
MSTKQIGGYTVYLSQVLGHGSYGNVYRGVKDDDKELVAIKIIPKYLSKSAPMQLTRTNISRHPSIMR